MPETREIKEDGGHGLAGPHMDLPAGFVPLRLFAELEHVHIEVNRPIAVFGRHTGAELRFVFAEVSRRHCRFVFEHQQWRVYDLDSLNGIIRNGERVLEATLYAGDRLRIGCVNLIVESATVVRKDDKLRQIAEALPDRR